MAVGKVIATVGWRQAGIGEERAAVTAWWMLAVMVAVKAAGTGDEKDSER